METEKNDIQKGLLKTFKFFVAFLEKHNLHYIACGGTVLGAIRHKGFIPWDDDIDVYMPRKDYDRFQALRSEVLCEGYDILSMSDKGYYCPYIKVVDSHTTLWEVKQYPLVIGHYFIDVFPLDFVEGSDEEITSIQRESNKLFDAYLTSIAQYTFIDLCRAMFRNRNVRLIIKSWLSQGHELEHLKKFENFIKHHSVNCSEKCVCITQWAGKVFKTQWFEDVIEVPFEDTTVTIPKEYDAYLNLLYGDYMTPPEKRVSVHPHYFVDLNRRLTIDEVKEIKRK